MRLKILIALPVVITACASALTSETYEKYLTNIHDYQGEKCFAATAAALNELGYEIDNQDPESGKIISKRKESTYLQTKYSGESSDTYEVPIATKYYFSITSLEEKSCEIKVERFRIWHKGKEVEKMNVKYVNEYYWQPILNEIKEKLNDGV